MKEQVKSQIHHYVVPQVFRSTRITTQQHAMSADSVSLLPMCTARHSSVRAEARVEGAATRYLHSCRAPWSPCRRARRCCRTGSARRTCRCRCSDRPPSSCRWRPCSARYGGTSGSTAADTQHRLHTKSTHTDTIMHTAEASVADNTTVCS